MITEQEAQGVCYTLPYDAQPSCEGNVMSKLMPICYKTAKNGEGKKAARARTMELEKGPEEGFGCKDEECCEVYEKAHVDYCYMVFGKEEMRTSHPEED